MSSSDRQRVVRVAGARRAKLTPAPDTTAEPVKADDDGPEPMPPAAGGTTASGPNDEQLRRDVPPHY